MGVYDRREERVLQRERAQGDAKEDEQLRECRDSHRTVIVGYAVGI